MRVFPTRGGWACVHCRELRWWGEARSSIRVFVCLRYRQHESYLLAHREARVQNACDAFSTIQRFVNCCDCRLRWVKDLLLAINNLPSVLRVEPLRVDIDRLSDTKVPDRVNFPFTHEFEFAVSGHECEESNSRDWQDARHSIVLRAEQEDNYCSEIAVPGVLHECEVSRRGQHYVLR